jgi:epoxyqueuosine reductase
VPPTTIELGSADQLRRVGLAAGLDAVGVASAEPFADTRAILEQRKQTGLNGSMQFTYRNSARSTTPTATLPSARALVVAAKAYDAGRSDRPPDRPTGQVARYATSDTYAALRGGLEAVAGVLRDEGWQAVVVADDNALVDREAAVRAGLGWYGKSSNVLLPDRGSWFVLGSVITDAPLAPEAVRVADGCGSCHRCIDGCPTGAIVAPGVVDARRCLAWLLQAEGDFPLEFREALGDRLYGCDDCQEVCPPNRRNVDEPSSAAASERDAAWVDLLELLDADDDALLAAHGRWYIAARDPRYLRRNALIVLGNTADRDDPRVTATLERYLETDDEMLQAHAAWAKVRLASRTPAA